LIEGFSSGEWHAIMGQVCVIDVMRGVEIEKVWQLKGENVVLWQQ
jgi:hypothetical protein